ncbi:glycerophosphodiester phosphodiesterase GDPD1, chloroplastic-like [Telopea speciosissima]|uniref:glycerophosphodiester phosphodiesterase GDPD1, chloroplastic-like n=1 Tax=Telopea speciosissima TaxID=54955 RepID=UPI001CC6131E|nr:glycerophosphodiester phosphodiesterase GDPD1, chloroplastic-like [Telopea speciosissima]
MALKAVLVSDVPNLDQVPEHAATAIYSSRFPKGNDGAGRSSLKWPKFQVIGHRGSGMNMLHSPDRRMKAIKENSILSFNTAGKFGVDFVEFDVQVTKDDCPVIFHDDFILTEENGEIFERRLTDLTSAEFLCYGPKREPGNVGKTLLRKTKDGRIFNWKVEEDDAFCTLQEAFQKVTPSLGFNIELKFDDHIVYRDEELIHALQAVLRVVFEYANERPIIFSTFQPDAARLIKMLQSIYPVFFLTNGGTESYTDVRRNSLEEAVKLCLACGLQGIVSEVKGIFRNPAAVNTMREANLSLLTYGQLNNVPEAVYMQYLMGVDGVIVDLVQEITAAVSDYINPVKEEDSVSVGDGQIQTQTRPKFSQRELSFLLKLIPELIQV